MPLMHSREMPSGGRGQDIGIGRQGPDLVAAVGRRAERLELGQPADVDELAGLGQTQLHERQEAHPAGQDLGVAAGDGGQGVVERRRPLVVERCRDHAWPPFADSIAPHTFWAV